MSGSTGLLIKADAHISTSERLGFCGFLAVMNDVWAYMDTYKIKANAACSKYFAY